MAETGIKLYSDEDVPIGVALQLNRQGYDVLTCLEAGNANQGLSDGWQLNFATQHRRTILVHNINDFVVVDERWRSEGREHYGIILA